LANSNGPFVFKRELFCKQFGHKLEDAVIQNCLIPIKPLYVAIVGAPPHPLRLRWQVPFVRITVANQSAFDFGFAAMGTIVWIEEL
jgi:hypothetical protein